MRIEGVTDKDVVLAPRADVAAGSRKAQVEQSTAAAALAAPAPVTAVAVKAVERPAERRASVPVSFDPPLIAQRAVLGWPVGPMVAEYARETGTSIANALAEVDRARQALAGSPHLADPEPFAAAK